MQTKHLTLLGNEALKLLELSKLKELDLAQGVVCLERLALKNFIQLFDSLQLGCKIDILWSVFQISGVFRFFIVLIHEVLQMVCACYYGFMERLVALELADILLDVLHL